MLADLTSSSLLHPTYLEKFNNEWQIVNRESNNVNSKNL